MEDKGSGRVKLVDFYHAAIYEGKYQFTETINYLRQIGTLDESDATTPRVIIPNYISGLSNCIARTSYYSVCCLDACEILFGGIEKQLGKPNATPSEVAAIVEVQRKKTLSPSLRRRLDEMAQHHNGAIPIHGRLFSQWMHLAYPTECVYPHVSGTTYKKTMEQWEAETGERSGSTLEEIVEWTNHLQESQKLSEIHTEGDGQSADKEAGEFHGMWTMEEELLVVAHTGSQERSQNTQQSVEKPWAAVLLSVLVFIVALGAALLGLSGRSVVGVAGRDIGKFV